MKKKLLYIILLSLTLGAVSCSDFLNEEHKTKYTTDYIFGSEEGLQLAVDALYNRQRYYLNDTECSSTVAFIRATDLAISNGGTGNYFGTYDANNLKPSSSQVGWMWKNMYYIIGKANDIINAAEKLPDTKRLRGIVAEARCFRAQSYFLLYRTFDRIWLNTISTTPENVNQERDFHAATPSEVFTLLYEDFDYAITNLDWLSSEPGRFNRAAACHMKAKAALWIKDWDTAADNIDLIDGCPDYGLVDITEVFNNGDLNHKEALMTQQWSKNPGGNLSDASPKGNYLAAQFIAMYRSEIGGTNENSCSYQNWGYTYGRCLPSPYLFSLYDTAKDKRYTEYYVHQYYNTTKANIAYGGVTVKPGEPFPARKNGVMNRNVLPGCVKYGDIWTRGPAETSGYKDIIVYRLAESYIIGAEAYLMKNNQGRAKYYYNKTWERAGNSTYTASLSIKDIIDEQARELAFEGDRWYFLKRLGILIDQVKNYAGHPEYAASLAGRTNLPKNPHFVRWPIPEAEVISMGADKFPQNIGYN